MQYLGHIPDVQKISVLNEKSSLKSKALPNSPVCLGGVLEFGVQ